ncbi:ammonium transporter AmtB-like domain-containing protein [Pavlovales sp. CCMP2436]|nr:ammonium transporter AmtB-like domain-containing protein [Pavlovales sp. CCMP2436]
MPLSVEYNADTNSKWLIIASLLVFMMHCGFAMLCAGCVRAKNTKNILLENILDACVGAIAFSSFGFAFAYGEAYVGNPFVGKTFFLTNFGGVPYASWLFQWAFAATAGARSALQRPLSRAVAERRKMAAYILYSLFLTAWVYLVVVHWIYSSAGWLSAFNKSPLLGTGLIDFAGCRVVHMVSSMSAASPLCDAYVVGPRIGRYDSEGRLNDLPGHSLPPRSLPRQVLGTFVLWIGWYGFNPGSTLAITGGLGVVASKCAVTTTLASAAAAIGGLALYKYWECSIVEAFAAVIIGLIGSVVYALTSEFVKHVLKIDDVVDAFALHCGGGMWGLIAASLFATKVWVGGLMAFFTIVHKLSLIRSPPDEEEVGMDMSKHGGPAFRRPRSYHQLCSCQAHRPGVGFKTTTSVF